MKTLSLRTVGQYIGGVLVVAGFVGLLSFIFSFLGNLFCAALAGMMLGALRTYKWQAVGLSLLFPLVLIVLLKGMKTELDARHLLMLGLASFSIFWLTYLAAAMMFFAEQRESRPGSSAKPQALSSTAPTGLTRTETPAAAGAAMPERNGALGLELLQGTWFPEVVAAQQSRRQLSIEKGELILSETHPSGEVRVLARAQVKMRLTDPPGSPASVELDAARPQAHTAGRVARGPRDPNR